MNKPQEIQDFVAQKTLAIVGMSRAPQSFGSNAAKELSAKGYRLFLVNPNAPDIQGEKCYPSVAALPEQVGGALFLTPPSATEQCLREAVAAGVTHLWIQQGAESKEALAFCEEKNLSAVSGHCILMFAEPVGSFHRVHRFFKGLFGGLPK
jgi:predicted CoA-binding protein